MTDIFKNAKYGDKFVCRNGTIAYYGRHDATKDRHFLMTQDPENDFVLAYPDGHIFHINPDWKNPRTGKTVCETYGWNYEELKDFRLDIVSRLNDEDDNILSCLPKVWFAFNQNYELNIHWYSSYWRIGYTDIFNKNGSLAEPSGHGQSLNEAICDFINSIKIIEERDSIKK